jgi:ribokinase
MKSLTIGGAMVDTIAIIESDRIERMILGNADTSFLLLEEGRKTEAEEISTHCGGGAVNAAVSMARLGLEVSTIVKLGSDQRAQTVLVRLDAEGVSTRFAVHDADAPTGAAVMVSSHERNAAVFTFRGANTLLKEADLADDAFAVDLVYVAGLSNESAACFRPIIEKAKAAGATIAANPGIRQLSARTDDVAACLEHIDILSINRVEADTLVPFLVGRFGEGGPALALKPGETPPDLVARGLAGGGYEMAYAAFCSGLLKLGVGCVLITVGPNGAMAATKDEIAHCPAFPSILQGTAGAGDAFGSTFSAYRAAGVPIDKALQAASINAASVVDHIDTQTGLLKRDALDARLDERVHEIPVRKWPMPKG